MNFYEFDKILKENTGGNVAPGAGIQNVGASSGVSSNVQNVGPKFQTLSMATKGLKSDKKELTASAFNGLQQLYNSLKVLGENDPGTLLQITRKIKSAISGEDPELAKILTRSANKLVAGLR